MKRSPLKTDPEKVREWRRKHANALRRSTELERGKRLNPINRKRRRKLREKQFGAKAKWLREAYPRCVMTGRYGSDFLPVDHAHVLGTRGAGADASGIVPLWRPVHIDFDGSMTDERFALKWGFTRDDVRAKARTIDDEWRRAA